MILGINTEEVDGYFLLNGRLSYALPMLAEGSEVFLALENLTNNTDYEYRPDYPMPGTTAMLGSVNLALR
ncbi:MAG: TonB-dependent receptor [Chromatiaceae bacterium]|nr:TonB-dependent receptor [Chromatiaceae bacterium]